MQRTAAGRLIILSSLGVLAMGAIALTGWFHPNAPNEAMSAYLPAITLPTVLAAAALDGINPCAFTVLLLFITSLLALLPAGPVDHRALRGRMLRLGSIYIGAVFLTYLALGVGLLQAIDVFSRQHLPARLSGLAAVLLGLWMLKDYFLPELGPRLQAPRRVAEIARRAAGKATVPSIMLGGVFIGLCTVPCSGAVYLGVLSLLALQPTTLAGYGYLVLYNAVFVLPLALILAAAVARPALSRLSHWNLHHKEWMRLGLGALAIGMGLLILATV